MRAPLFAIALCAGVAWAQGLPTLCKGASQDFTFNVEKVDYYPGLVLPEARGARYVRVRIGSLNVRAGGNAWATDSSRFLLFRTDASGAIQAVPFTMDSDTTGDTKFLTLPPTLPAGSVLQVYVLLPEKDPAGKVVEICVAGGGGNASVPVYSRWNALLEPSWIPKQELINGAKRDVGHLNFVLDAPNLASLGWARMYLKVDQVFSSDGKDVSTRLEEKLGLTGRVPGSWFIPWTLETKLISDQRFENASSVSTFGVRGLVPWGWSRPALWNGLVRAPFSPEWFLGGQFERRIEQDAASKAKFADQNAFRLAAEFAWTPIHLLTGPDYSRDDLSIEIAGKGWYLPNQRRLDGRKFDRLEGYLQASLLVPVRKFALVAGLSPAGSEAAKQRVRLSYSYGANEANGFKPVNQVSLGYEFIK
jgi:hypothetical protein